MHLWVFVNVPPIRSHHELVLKTYCIVFFFSDVKSYTFLSKIKNKLINYKEQNKHHVYCHLKEYTKLKKLLWEKTTNIYSMASYCQQSQIQIMQ